MITAEQAKSEIARLKQEEKDAYWAEFPKIYGEAMTKLEAAIKTAIEGRRSSTHIILHDPEVILKLKAECEENGYSIIYDKRERHFEIRWD